MTSHETDFPPENDDDVSSSQRYASEDDDGSLASSQSREVSFIRGIYVAIYDFVADSERELSMSAGDIVTVFSRQCAGWVRPLSALRSLLRTHAVYDCRSKPVALPTER